MQENLRDEEKGRREGKAKYKWNKRDLGNLSPCFYFLAEKSPPEFLFFSSTSMSACIVTMSWRFIPQRLAVFVPRQTSLTMQRWLSDLLPWPLLVSSLKGAPAESWRDSCLNTLVNTGRKTTCLNFRNRPWFEQCDYYSLLFLWCATTMLYVFPDSACTRNFLMSQIKSLRASLAENYFSIKDSAKLEYLS